MEREGKNLPKDRFDRQNNSNNELDDGTSSEGNGENLTLKVQKETRDVIYYSDNE